MNLLQLLLVVDSSTDSRAVLWPSAENATCFVALLHHFELRSVPHGISFVLLVQITAVLQKEALELTLKAAVLL